MAGTPLLNLLQQTLAGSAISEMKGILNGTTNYILTQMEEGMDYAAALKQAQELGYAEAVPDADVLGWDALAKVTILANTVFGASLAPDDSPCTGITEITSSRSRPPRQRQALQADRPRVGGRRHRPRFGGTSADGPVAPARRSRRRDQRHDHHHRHPGRRHDRRPRRRPPRDRLRPPHRPHRHQLEELKMKMLLADQWVDREKTIDVRDPFDNSLIDTVPAADADDIETALAAADAARATARAMSTFDRSQILLATAEIVADNLEDFAETIAREGSKTIKEARGEAKRTVNTLTISGEEAKRLLGETIPFDSFPGGEQRRGHFERVPIGVVVAITPFNDPLNLVAHKLGPPSPAATRWSSNRLP